MKYIKTFEMIMNTAEVGDYVLCSIKETDPEEQVYTDQFLNNNIGQLVNIDDYPKNGQGWYVKFKKRPPLALEFNELYKSFDFKTKMCAFYDDEIIFWSKDRVEVESRISAKQYNL